MRREKLSRRWLLKAAAATVPFSAVGLAPSVSIAQNAIKLRLSHDEPATMITHGVLTEMAAAVEKQTNGEVTIAIFPGAQLAGGNLKAQFQQNQAGAIDIAITATGILNNWTPRADIISLPFLLSGVEDMKKLVSSSVGDDVKKAVEPLGLYAVDIWARDLRHWVNVKRPIITPDDIKGLRFRVPETSLWVATFRALGATPTPMSFGEVFTAIQLGTLDGAERPTEFIVGEKWQSIAKYLTISAYTGDALMPTFNKARWSSLPPDVQRILTDAFRTAGEAKFEREKSMRAIVIDTMRKAGMEVNVLTSENREAFKRGVTPVWEQWGAKLPAGMIERAQMAVGS
ncbi:TRAP transporter substrate-binding protein [Xanthobacter sp. KR7-225]|uniref:TRAP transporter substrate-binding protein n=1 Tax=Xanthobacter sp. KR7-225 TaxID=3156613 RepID=UPI0032B587B7